MTGRTTEMTQLPKQLSSSLVKQASISVSSIFVGYSNGVMAIQDASFELGSASICGLVGVNGSGKSTLFKTLMGFLSPARGTVAIAGLPVSSALKAGIVAYVPQAEEVDWTFPVLVDDVVMMGRYGHMGLMRIPSKKDRVAVDEALARVDMTAYRRRQIGELSGGQRKRVFLARALAQGASVVLLDEPFTGVDVKTEEAIITLLREMRAQGCLMFVATHNLGSVPEFCDQVVLFNKTVLAYGPTESVFTEANLAKAFGSVLRHVRLGGTDLHDDADGRSVTVLTDDERPLVLYGERARERVIAPERQDSTEPKGQESGKP